MPHAITTDLYADRLKERIAAKDAVLDIEDHPGLQAILAQVEQRKLDLTTQLLAKRPTDQGADYADFIGQLKGLEELPLLVQGVIEQGREAEIALREQD